MRLITRSRYRKRRKSPLLCRAGLSAGGEPDRVSLNVARGSEGANLQGENLPDGMRRRTYEVPVDSPQRYLRIEAEIR
jgi:hypothetical protein